MPPAEPARIPAVVAELAAGGTLRLAWQNASGGLTYEISGGADGGDAGAGPGSGAARRFVKWSPAGSGRSIAAEAARIRWAADFTAVPRILDEGEDAVGAWMVTAALPGSMAAAEPWKSDPAAAVRAIGTGLRALHERLPVASCPFDWSADSRFAIVRARAAAGRIDPDDWHEDLRHLGPADRAVALLADTPPVERAVVCHGDACTPNTLIAEDGGFSGHVDLGRLGVADRWADLAVATWSVGWNYGVEWEGALLDAYGVAPDPERTTYYRMLYELEG